jgi:molybdenum cofactor biosynthesis protein B
MVDFQSRDTRRGPTVDDDESESSSDTAEHGEDDATEAEDAAGGTTNGDGPTVDGDGPNTDGADATETSGTETDPLVEDSPAAAGTAGEHGETEAGVATDEAARTTSETATPSRAIDVAVVTVSGDRESLEDTVASAFERAGHTVARRERLRGGYDGIQQMVDALVDREAVDVVVTVGGVGLAADEMAIEAVHPLLEKALPGFGEAFRARLADHIGTGIVGVRSTAGISDGTLVFCLPGDAEAAELAVREILAAEAPVLVEQLAE